MGLRVAVARWRRREVKREGNETRRDVLLLHLTLDEPNAGLDCVSSGHTVSNPIRTKIFLSTAVIARMEYDL